MENLELQTQIINLGKLFVKELKLEPGVDTFSKWMAHYIAEKMTLAEQLPIGQDKSDAEKECFETILKLWEYRWSLPSRKQPLKEFEPILKVLQGINPENQESFFYRSIDRELSEMENENPDSKEISSFIKMISQIDKVARIWIDDILHQAALKVKNVKTEVVLKNAISLHDNEDVKIIQIILDNDSSNDLKNYKDDDIQKKYRIEKLKRRIEELNKFKDLNTAILEKYKRDLESLS